MSACACGRITNGARPACDRCSALAVLGLTQTATQTEIKDAYRVMAKVWHPDRFPGDEHLRERAEEKLKEINSAYQLLATTAAEGAGHRSSRPGPTAAPKAGASPPSPGPQPSSAKTSPPKPASTSRVYPSPKRKRQADRVRIAVAVVVLVAAGLWVALKYGPSALSHLATSTTTGDSVPAAGRTPASTVGNGAAPVADAGQRAANHPARAAEKPVVNPHNQAAASERASLVIYPSDDPQVPYFTVGSTRNDVLRVQGKPGRVTGDLFAYGLSEVYFKDGRVVSWHIDTSSPLKARMPDP